MRKSIVVLSTVAALSTSAFAATISNEEMMQQIEALKAQIATLEGKLEKTPVVNDDRFQKLEKKVDLIGSTAAAAKQAAAGDNIKWDIDFRTQFDNIQYKTVGGNKYENNALLTNRLLLGAAYAPNDNTVFQGKLSYNKAWGDTANHSQSNSAMGVGYADFDWVTNENAVDNEVKVKEAYWLYKDKTIGGVEIPWTVSVGRRPSTDGLPSNLRHMQKEASPLSHVVDVEFDGFSAKFDLEKVTGATGSWFKICGGRGLTNAKPRFSMDGLDYAEDDSKNVNVDMLGFIAVPYDDGQYSVHINYAHAWDLIGFEASDMIAYQTAAQGYDPDMTTWVDTNGDSIPDAPGLQLDGSPSADINGMLPLTTTSTALIPSASMQYAPDFQSFGDMDYATILFKVDGIGDGISDYLDDTTVFASYAMSRTSPKGNMRMLGSNESKIGHSYWIGVNAPCPISQDSARIGIEWNKGSKYWRSMTYGEDRFTGSKLAARGTAWEVYRNQKINDALSWGLSYTKIDYDYYGSNSFFGEDGNPDLPSLMGGQLDWVKEAQNATAYVRYKF